MRLYPRVFLVTFLFLGIFLMFWAGSSLISAKSLWEEDQSLISDYSSSQKSYIQALGIYKEARADYNAALKIFLSSKKSSEDKENFLSKVKNLFFKANESLISYTNLVKKKIAATKFLTDKEKQDFLKIFDDHTSVLNSQRSKITNLANVETAKSLSVEIKDEARKVEIDAKKIAGYLMISRANLFISKAEQLTLKIEEKIEILEIQGKNTTEIKKWLVDFKTKITLAKEKVNLARGKFEAMKASGANSSNLFDEGLDAIKEAKQALMEAYNELKKIIGSLAKQKNIKVISGTGTLEVKGSGKIILKGSFEVAGLADSEGKGTIVITDNKGDVRIDTKAKGQKEELGNNQIRYTGVGEINVFGSGLTVQIIGNQLEIAATGTGIVYLKGEGTYKIGSDNFIKIPEAGLNIRLTQ